MHTAGVLFNYCILQILMWAVVHAIFLFWAVHYPFSYRLLRVSGKMRYAHIISVLLALIIPLPGALIPLKDGFITTRNPTLVCVGRNVGFTFYTLILPLSIIIGITLCLLLFTFWTLFKVTS